MKKLIKIVYNCLFYLISIFLLILIIISFTSDNDGFMKINRYSFFYVEGDSMYPVIKDGDYIAINTNIKNKYEEGDVISFYYEIDEGYIIVVHKIVKSEVVGNSYSYITRGINNDDVDEKIVTSEQIIGEYKGFRVPLLGYVVEFGRTQIGYFILVVMPLGLVLLISTYELIKEIDKRKKGEI